MALKRASNSLRFLDGNSFGMGHLMWPECFLKAKRENRAIRIIHFFFFFTPIFIYCVCRHKCLCLSGKKLTLSQWPQTIAGRNCWAWCCTLGTVKSLRSSRPLNSFGWFRVWKSISQLGQTEMSSRLSFGYAWYVSEQVAGQWSLSHYELQLYRYN